MRLFVGALLVVMSAGCAAPELLGSTDPRVSPTASPAPSSTPEPDPATPTTMVTEAPTPSAPTGSFQPDQVVAVVTTDLVVRTAPGTDTDSEILPDRYNAPDAVFVVDGPTYADGYEWYLVDAVRGHGIGEYPWPGWVAAAGKDGEPWLAEEPYVCATPADVDLLNLERQRALACYGDSRLTLEGTLVGCEAAFRHGSQPWDTECVVVRRGFDPSATPDFLCYDCFEPSLTILFDGDVGLTDLPAGTQVTVQGHFDDPAARTCTRSDGIYVTRALQVHVCRMSFVATSGMRLHN